MENKSYLKRIQANWEQHPYKCIFTVIGVAVVIMVIVYLCGPRTEQDVLGGPTQFGQFGDYIGGVLNPIFGFLTVLLLIGTSQHSRLELDLSRQEYTRKQLEDTLEALFSKHKQLLETTMDSMLFGFGVLSDFTLAELLERDEKNKSEMAARLGRIVNLPPAMATLARELKLTMALAENVAKDVLALTPRESLQDYWHTRVMDMKRTCKKCGLFNGDDLLQSDTFLRTMWGKDVMRFS